MKTNTHPGLLLALAAASVLAPSGARGECLAPTDDDVWMVRSGGYWKQEGRYGDFRVILTRTGVEHAQDRVQVQISGDDGKNRTILRCLDLPSPGLKGYVQDIRIRSVDDRVAAIELPVEIKAMEGIVLLDAFLVSVDGKVEQISEAKYADVTDFATLGRLQPQPADYVARIVHAATVAASKADYRPDQMTIAVSERLRSVDETYLAGHGVKDLKGIWFVYFAPQGPPVPGGDVTFYFQYPDEQILRTWQSQ